MKKNVIDIITLGCSKNLVDSEKLMGKLENVGFKCTHDSIKPTGEIAVINTCGFIEAAKQESIDTILRFVQAKNEGRLRYLFVMGCLSQRYREELIEELPQVDKFYGKFDFNSLITDLGKLNTPNCGLTRHITTPKHYAYIKISEGCDRKCSYCAIPLMTGNYVSRKQKEIIEEMEMLVERGVKEFQIIAQDLTFYGRDFDGKAHIAELLELMSKVKGAKWIRLHYAYPAQFPLEMLSVMRNCDNICNYIDIALQHISGDILRKMHRNISPEETYKLIERIRKEVPKINIRTTFMVGFPGESEKDFEELLRFTSQMRFERMGAFAYSEEENTYASQHFKDDIPKEVKQERLNRLMTLQQTISQEIQNSLIGTVNKVIIDRKEGPYYIGRSEHSSPEVDPEILIPANERKLTIGRFYNVKITEAEEFDLYATTIINQNANEQQRICAQAR